MLNSLSAHSHTYQEDTLTIKSSATRAKLPFKTIVRGFQGFQSATHADFLSGKFNVLSTIFCLYPRFLINPFGAAVILRCH